MKIIINNGVYDEYSITFTNKQDKHHFWKISYNDALEFIKKSSIFEKYSIPFDNDVIAYHAGGYLYKTDLIKLIRFGAFL